MTVEDYVVEVLEAGAVQDARSEFDVDAIADELREKHGIYRAHARGVSYELDGKIDDDIFWGIVQAHAR